MAVITVVVALPSWLAGHGFRERASAYVQRNFDLELDYESLGVGLLPLRIEIEGPRLVDARGKPALQAHAAAIDIDWRTLLDRKIVIERVGVKGALFSLVRDESGVRIETGIPLPFRAAPSRPQAASAGSTDVALEVRHFALRDTRVRYEDRLASRAIELVALAADIEVQPDGIVFEGEASVSTGGRASFRGRADADDGIEAQLTLEAVGLPGFALLFEDLGIRELGGWLAGTIRLARVAGGGTSVLLDLRSSETVLVVDDASLRGPLTLSAEFQLGEDGLLEGPFELDATRATLEYGGAFRKPPGEAASLVGTIRRGADGKLAVDSALRIRNLDSDAALRTGSPLTLRLDSRPVDLAGWESAVPALAPLRASGLLRFDGFTVAVDEAGGARLRGALELIGLELYTSESSLAPIAIDGVIRADALDLHTKELRLATAGGVVEVEGTVGWLRDEPRYDLGLRTPEPVASEGFLTSVSGLEDSLYGPLHIEGRLSGPIAAEGAESILEGLEGSLRFRVGGDGEKGRIVGLAMLHSVLKQLELVASSLVSRARRQEGQARLFKSDEFDELSASIELADGIARTNDLAIVYPGYLVTLQGTLRLADLGLDMSGRIRISAEIDRVLSGGQTRRARTISVAHIGGTLTDPVVSIAREAVVELASAYLLGFGLDALGGVLRSPGRLRPEASKTRIGRSRSNNASP